MGERLSLERRASKPEGGLEAGFLTVVRARRRLCCAAVKVLMTGCNTSVAIRAITHYRSFKFLPHFSLTTEGRNGGRILGIRIP